MDKKKKDAEKSQAEASTSNALTEEPLDKPEAKDDRQQTNEDLDPFEVVISHIGDFGLYQKILFCSMLPFGLTLAFVYLVQMFIVATPEKFWCYVPELKSIKNATLRRILTTPTRKDGTWDSCIMFDVKWDDVILTLTPPPENTATVACNKWEFEFSDIPYPTIVTERGWVCDKDHYATVAQTVFFVGSIPGGMLTGWMADKHGRVPALIAANILGFIGSVSSIFTSRLWDFCLARFIAGMAFDNCFNMIFILVLEYVGPQYRALVANMSVGLFFGGGCCILPWLAYFIANWRTLMWVTSLPMLSALVAPFVVPESAPWLASQGRTDRVTTLLRRIEKVNKTEIPPDVLNRFIMSAHAPHSTETMSTMMKSPLLRVTMLYMLLLYGMCGLVYDGLVRVTENLGFDFFISFTLAAVMEIPGNAVIALFLDRFGRLMFTAAPMATTAVTMLVASFIPKGVWVMAILLISRFAMILGCNAAVQWVSEILPTPVRASGSSAVHISGFVGTLISPAIIFSERLWTPLPLVILSVFSLIGAGVSILLPETKGQPMPQTIADGEKLVKYHSLCRKHKSSNKEESNEASHSSNDKPRQPPTNS